MKRLLQTDTNSSTSQSSKKPRRQVSLTTFNKWQVQFERDYQAMTWLRCEVSKENPNLVETLWCYACRSYEEMITGMKNFSSKWIVVLQIIRLV